MSKRFRISDNERDLFNMAWEDNDKDALFKLCNTIRERWKLPRYNYAEFDNGWQHRTVLHERRPYAYVEFFSLCRGWW